MGKGFLRVIWRVWAPAMSAKVLFLAPLDRYPSYHETLSLASKGTLINQGGPMNSQEATAFERHPDFHALLEMRRWDDMAKNKDIPLHDNIFYENLCRTILTAQDDESYN